jgi:ABC-type polysaccharide/polyol phosphate transport system ATPase subunit
MTSYAITTDSGVLGIHSEMRTKRSKRFKNLPRVLSSHELSSYWIFRHASVSLEPHDALIVLSPEPLQSTTFMRMMCSLLPTDEGTVLGDARSLLTMAVKKRVVRTLSVRQSVFMLAGLGGLTDAEVAERFARIASMARIKKILNERIDELPHAIWQQIAFSVAMFAPADILAFDGTATVGEPKFLKQCPARLQSARDAGQALMLTTRDPNLVRSLGTKAILLDDEATHELSISEAASYISDEKKSGRRKRRKTRRQMDMGDDEETLGF